MLRVELVWPLEVRALLYGPPRAPEVLSGNPRTLFLPKVPEQQLTLAREAVDHL